MDRDGSASALVVEERRGGVLEARHEVSAVLVDPEGRIVERVGPSLVTTMRSAAKPFQLEVSLEHLSDSIRSSVDEIELALGAASHSAQPRHVERVEALLARLGRSVEHLYCGAHWPIHEDSGRALVAAGRSLSALHNNCSGKHSFMAAASASQGWPEDYRDPRHPLQVAIRQNMERRTGGRIEGCVIDGCGVPCWVAPLEGFATAWAQLARAMGSPEDTLGRIGWAMHRNPWWMSGDGRIDAALVEGARRPVVSKVGAAALLCLAIPGEALGLALKVHTGNDNARAVAVCAVLDHWLPGLVPQGVPDSWGLVRNVVGDVVGGRTAVWGNKLQRHATN